VTTVELGGRVFRMPPMVPDAFDRLVALFRERYGEDWRERLDAQPPPVLVDGVPHWDALPSIRLFLWFHLRRSDPTVTESWVASHTPTAASIIDPMEQLVADYLGLTA
jgi:hypothetical protein